MTATSAETSPDKASAPIWDDVTLAPLRKDMLRFAVLQLRNREMAEDVVQESIIAALAASERFDHRSALKTWVFSILKNKIIDVFRDRWNKNRLDITSELGDETDFDALFKQSEHWQRAERPSDWGDPEACLENNQFWAIMELCMSKLPEATARVFTMREFLGLETDEICKELGLSTSNCWVILHRARMSLRICLQRNWFEKDMPIC